MNIIQQFKFSARRMIYVLLIPATIALNSNQLFAENSTVKLVNKVESAESIDKDSRRHDVSFERVAPTEVLSWTLTAEQWEIARNGESILSLAVLNDLIRTWLSSTQSLQNNTRPLKSEIIEIQYPGGEEGEVWVQELTDWLVALGVPSRFISVTPGSAVDDEIKFQMYKK